MVRILPVLIIVLGAISGCTRAAVVAPAYPERLPVAEQVKEVAEVPEYVPPTEGGQVEGISEGEEAPFDGVVITEDKAVGAAQLRIAYDEVYRLLLSDHSMMLAVVTIQEQELYRADAALKAERSAHNRLKNSWWHRHKLAIGITTGLIVGVGLSLGAGKIWSRMDNR